MISENSSSPLLPAKGKVWAGAGQHKSFPDFSPSQGSECQAPPVQLWQGCSYAPLRFLPSCIPALMSVWQYPVWCFRQPDDHFSPNSMLWTVVITHCSVNSLDIHQAGVRRRAGCLTQAQALTSPSHTCLLEGQHGAGLHLLAFPYRDIVLLSLQHQGCCFLVGIQHFRGAWQKGKNLLF